MSLMPEGNGSGSTEVPVTKTRLVATVNPLRGEVTVTTGGAVSGVPPGTMLKWMVPGDCNPVSNTGLAIEDRESLFARGKVIIRGNFAKGGQGGIGIDGHD